jgi:VanZ family protein
LRRLGYWIPPAVWTAIILLASSDFFSASHTGSFLEAVVTSVLGHSLSPETFATMHFVVRKSAHLTEYGILGALLFRAIRSGRAGWDWRWAATAVLLAASVAAVDEWHQTFIPSRTGTPRDVLIDATGAAVAQLVWVAVDAGFIRKKRYANNLH